MTKEQELMSYLHEKVFDLILNSETVPAKIKIGVNITIARMNRLSAEKMVQYLDKLVNIINVTFTICEK